MREEEPLPTFAQMYIRFGNANSHVRNQIEEHCIGSRMHSVSFSSFFNIDRIQNDSLILRLTAAYVNNVTLLADDLVFHVLWEVFLREILCEIPLFSMDRREGRARKSTNKSPIHTARERLKSE